MKIGLVGCVARKLAHAAPACDLYTSDLFRGRSAVAESTCDRWFILSALHGLVEPDDLLEPYDLALSDLRVVERRAWSRQVLEDLKTALGPLGAHRFEVHAGAAYTDAGLLAGLRAAGAQVELPVAGLRLGEQLAWYGGRVAGGSPEVGRGMPGPPVSARSSGKYGPLRVFLLDEDDDVVILTFDDLERVLGEDLPVSARRHTAWWGNGAHAHSRAWLDAGYRVVDKDLADGWVRFRRDQ